MSVGQYDRLKQLAEDNPAEFRRIMLALNKVTVKPHAGQQLVLQNKARFKVLNCGRRWGKTILAAKLALKAARKKDQMIWWVAPTYKVTKRGYAEILKQLPPGALAHDPPPESNFDSGRSVILRFTNGTRMEFYSAERPEGMLGAAVDFAVLDEAATMPQRIYNQIVSPTLIDHKGKALLISTPRGRNWFYDCWIKGQDPQQHEWASWTFTTQDNPTLPEGEADRMAADMPKMEADQEIFAKWIAAGAQVFAAALANPQVVQHNIVLDNCMVEGVPPRGPVFLGIDLARTSDYTVMYGTRDRDRKNCYFERFHDVAWSEQRRRISSAVRRLEKAGAEHVTLMVDEGNAGSVIVEDLEEAGFDVIGVNFTSHKAPMVRLLANDMEQSQAFILDEMVSEFENYSMSVSPAGRFTYSAPEGQNDDVVSAKMLAHWGCVNEGFSAASLLQPDDPSSGTVPSDPGDEDNDEAWDDLLDPEHAGEVAESVGFANPMRRPTAEELIARPDVWLG